MKITKRQLRRIIREVAMAAADSKVKIPNSDFPIKVSYQDREDEVFNQEAFDELLDYLIQNGVPYKINEACALNTGTHSQDIPSPDDYNMVRQLLMQNQDVVDMGIAGVMQMAGVMCERSTAQAIIDHLQGMIAQPRPSTHAV